jgi:signal transduction histidine kinase
MRQLILDLLDLTRIESNEKSRTVDRTDVAELLKQCVETIREEANRRNIGVTIDGPDALPFRCDAAEFQMICNNLLSNAVKYNRDNGRVFVSLAMEGNRLTLTVTDTGIGIDKVNHGRLFKAFSRVKNQHTEHIQGSGLGLSILKNLVQLYDGTVTFESEPDKGSAFTVTLQEG